ncbi:sigma-70 family RNA polymerase sigma factor [Sphingobium sp.]|uniref:RNA polymerase sigma factor n=1 Tax=Sphingobium sp. TaxID=1912891 RepID=UPI000DB1F34A|nr:sigma-70 family RNA polymerase sigma factor [Sphingobium sp.]PZU68664.1 MAG: RNA polymerase subunit sigma-24 [Sphingobium sp.]
MTKDGQHDLAQLNHRFRPALLSFFRRRVRDHMEAEDLTQEVFIRLARQGNFAPESMEAYIFQTAANLLRDHARRQQVRRSYVQSVQEQDGRDIDILDPLRHIEARRELAAIGAHLANMPERMRHAFLLYRYEGVEKQTIAQSLGVSVSTVEKDVASALAVLASKLGRIR